MMRHRLQIITPPSALSAQTGIDRMIRAAAMVSFGFLLVTVLLAACYGAAAAVFWYAYGVRLPFPLG